MSATARTMPRFAALTFDLDTLARDIYRPALSAGDARRLEDVSFDRVIPRIADWLQRIGVQATFFTIGEYARRYGSVVRHLARTGHEVASHSQSHPRNFCELSRDAVRREVTEAHEVLTAAAGVPPVGFRAPGFTTSDSLMSVLAELGYRYDSSVVPSWTYTTLKHLYKTAGLAAAGYLYPESYGCVRAPQAPYGAVAGARFRDTPGGVLEIPITTASPLQWPLIYGLHHRAGAPVRRWLERAAASRPVMLMVFHDLEFAVPADVDGLPVGVLTGPHLGEALEARLARIEQWIDTARHTHRFVPLRTVAESYRAEARSVA